MAQLVLAAAGAAAGNALGWGIAALGMSGSAVGWAIGSLVGSMVGQKGVHNVQPGIGDKSVQASTYGAFQTIVYGTMRVAGNVIDGVSEVREVRTTTRVGKGGPKSTNTTITYNADVAIDIGQAGCLGVRKLWNAGKLVYDVSSGATADSIIASAIKATSFKLYDGSESQLPDPTLEAIHGVGNVPAYRGRSYIVLAGVDCPNGQIPQLTWEVCYSITPAATLPIFTPAPPFAPEYLFNAASSYSAIARVCGPDKVYHVALNYQAGTGGSYQISAQGFRLGSGYKQKLWSKVWASLGTGTRTVIGMNGSVNRPLAVRSGLHTNANYATANTINVIDLLTGIETTVRSYVPGTVDYDFVPGCAAYDEVSGKYILLGSPAGGRTYERFNPQIYTSGNLGSARLALPATSGAVLAFYDDVVYAFDQRSSQTYLQRYSGSTGAFIDEVAGGPASLDCTTFATGADPATGVLFSGFLSAISAHAGGVFVYCKVNDSVWRITTSWELVSDTITNTTVTTEGVEAPYVEQDYIVEGPSVATPDSQAHYRVAATKSFDPLDVAVGDVINSICQLAGLQAGEIDTVAQTATMRGYAITRQASARSALEPLLKGYFVDAREQDGQIEFLNRAEQTSSFAVEYDELATGEDGGLADPFPVSRADVATLPRSVSVTYIDIDHDYQAGTQSAVRQTITNRNEQSEELAIATSAAHAATVAEVLLYDAWSVANTRTVKLSRKFSAVSPGDVGTFEYPEGVTTLQRVARAVDDGAIVTLDLVDGDAPLYSLSATGAAGNTGQASPGLIAPTRMEILDIPILRDADDDNGVYVAFAPYTTNWSGAALYRGADDATLAVVSSVTTSTGVGVATTALANWPDNTLDRVNTVLVEEVGAQASTDYETALNTGEGCWLIGDEILQALTATYVSSGVYLLSDLVRGLRGTERYKATHAAGERAVRLQLSGEGIARPLLDLGELGVPRQYRAITYGLALDSQPSTAFTAAGMALKPLSPVNFKRSALNGNSTLTWDRRSRLSGEFPDSTDIPLGEAAELYYVDVFADSGFSLIVRTLSADEPTVTYTLAQQAVDFGSYQATLYLRIHQVSALVGRGVPLEVTSTVANVNSTAPSLLAHMDGAGVITTPVDSSAYAFPAALVGSAALSTAQSKFSGSSLYVPGGAAAHGCNFDTSSAAHSFGTGDFTVEFWAYCAAATANRHSFAISLTGSIGSVTNVCMYLQLKQTTGAIDVVTYAGAAIDASIAAGAGSFAVATWNHIAVSRKAGTLRLFVNGVQKASAASAGSLNYSASMKVMVGGWQLESSDATYYDEVRITKGEALYFANFTPPAAPF